MPRYQQCKQFYHFIPRQSDREPVLIVEYCLFATALVEGWWCYCYRPGIGLCWAWFYWSSLYLHCCCHWLWCCISHCVRHLCRLIVNSVLQEHCNTPILLLLCLFSVLLVLRCIFVWAFVVWFVWACFVCDVVCEHAIRLSGTYHFLNVVKAFFKCVVCYTSKRTIFLVVRGNWQRADSTSSWIGTERKIGSASRFTFKGKCYKSN